MYNREALLDILASYLRMIDYDANKHPAAVLSDIRASIEYVLKMNEQKE